MVYPVREVRTYPDRSQVRGRRWQPRREHDVKRDTQNRLSIAEVQRLERLLEGDPRTEEMILRFITDKYGAESLLDLTPKVAEQIVRRPADFIRAAKQHCEPELGF